MCGILGAIDFAGSGFAVTEAYLRPMLATMEHRGPDGDGVWVDAAGRMGMGHRRLSIVDLSTAAAQPMSCSDGRFTVTYNGEIYNHGEIRSELKALGVTDWQTDHSDTEVLLHAFATWGIEAVHKFRGMFAFGLWDAKERELWLVRDRIGIKPLYYSEHHGRLTFASEIKALLQDPEQPRAMDEEALFHYLSFLTTPAPMTLFKGIRKLPGGCYLRVRADGSQQVTRYWDVLGNARPQAGRGEAELVPEILSQLRVGVNYRKLSDVPVGVFLSGGIDSSTNAALFAEGEGRPVKTFSIGYDQEYGSYKNELHYARQMADTIGAEYFEKKLTLDDLLSFLPRMVELQDEPIADPVCIPVYYLSKLARDNGVIVCQVGEGADELFCGYPYWMNMVRRQYLYNSWNPKRLAYTAYGLGMAAMGRRTSMRYETLRRGMAGQPLFWGGAEAFSDAGKRSLFSDDFNRRTRGLTSWEPIRAIQERFLQNAHEPSPLHWMGYLDLNLRLPELLLMRVDKMAMGASLEARVPFLDHRFVEFAMGIPEAMKVPNNQTKYLLKKAVRGVIPDELIDRKKQGFGVPVVEWALGALGNTMKQELDAFIDATGVFDRSQIHGMLARGEGQQLWYLLNLAMWWKRFIA